MTATDKDRALRDRLRERFGIQNATLEDMATLRRAAMTLHRWAELECGDSNDHMSVAIERDEETEAPYMVTHFHRQGRQTRVKIADREAGALKRVKATCEAIGLYCFHQTDPRGASLYIGTQPLTDTNYSMAGLAL